MTTVAADPRGKKLTDEDYQMQAQLLQAMLAVPTHDAAGVAFSYLLWLSEKDRPMLRRLLMERVVRNGFSGENMLTVLQRVAQS